MDQLLLQKELNQTFGTLTIVFPTDADYNKDCIISNLRFNYKPFAIVYCEEAADVVSCIQVCIKYSLPFRIRSGGHQHEGMCSADGVMVIDLTGINTIEYSEDNRTAWIPPGIHLKDVYSQLQARNRIIPGGGCGSVCVGGLTQGGGWGPSARKLGLTCDNIRAVELVLANGELVTATSNNQYGNLFWAIKGGGGGNFGVVTRFRFTLTPINGYITTFSLCFTKKDMRAIVGKWTSVADTMDENLTTFCRLSVVDKDTDEKPSVLLAGQFYGTKSDLIKLLKPFYDIAEPFNPQFKSTQYHETGVYETMENPEPGSGIHLELSNLLQHTVPAAPKETCDAPHPHKISSTFPIQDNDAALVDEMIGFLVGSKVFPNANTYLSLHGMGGAVRNGDNAFPYKEKKYMLQFQAWWADPTDPDTNNYMNWIETFRQALIPYTEGSFINFPDVNLVKDYKTTDGRLALLKFYYAQHLDHLRTIKAQYDTGNLFSFEMSIPPATRVGTAGENNE